MRWGAALYSAVGVVSSGVLPHPLWQPMMTILFMLSSLYAYPTEQEEALLAVFFHELTLLLFSSNFGIL